MENKTEFSPKEFKLALIQMKVEGGKPEENLARAADRIRTAALNQASLALLPEAMDLGWTHSSAPMLAGEIPGGRSFRALSDAARKYRIFVCAGIIEKSGGRIFNSAVLIGRDGELLLKHRKLNELDIAHDLYDQGDRLGVCTTELGTIGLIICADARSKDWSILKSCGYMGADLILSPSSWAVPPGYDQIAQPYGDIWREVYAEICSSFRVWIASVSNVGKISDGPWKDWDCIGSSMVYGPDGTEKCLLGYGAGADTIAYIHIKPEPRPARGTGWDSR